MQTKAELRRAALSRRQSLPADPDGAHHAAQHFLDAFPPTIGRTVAAYWPRLDEFDTRPLIGRLLDAGVEVGLPCIEDASRVLRFVRWDGRQVLTTGRFGIAQPPEDAPGLMPDLVLVPLLAFNRHGRRLGSGGGYYDATLAALRAKRPAVAIGFAYAQQYLENDIPAEPHDINLDWIVTPDGAQRFAAT